MIDLRGDDPHRPAGWSYQVWLATPGRFPWRERTRVKSIAKTLEKCVFRTFRNLDFGGVLGVGSAAKVVPKRSRVISNHKKFILIFFGNSIGEDVQIY